MNQEFSIRSSLKLDASEAMAVWNKFQSDANKLKTIDIKVKVSGLDGITKEMSNLLELVNKVNSAQSKMGGSRIRSGNTSANSSEMKKQLETLQKYKDTYRAIEKLRQQKSKGVNDSSLASIDRQITTLTSKLTTLQSKMSEATNGKRMNFVDSQEISSLVRAEKSLTDLSNKAEKLQYSFKGIEFKNVDSGRLEGDITSIVGRIQELQAEARQGVDINLKMGDALNDINRLSSEMKNLKELDSIRGDFANLEGSIQSALGVEAVERFRSELEQLEGSVMQTDGSFDRLAGSIRGSLGNASNDIRRVNGEMRNNSRFMSDFRGSFTQYTLGNVVADGIIKSIRGITTAFLEIDKGMTNINKVSDPLEVNSKEKLDAIRKNAIQTAKEVGKSSSEVMNAVADTLQAGIGITYIVPFVW